MRLGLLTFAISCLVQVLAFADPTGLLKVGRLDVHDSSGGLYVDLDGVPLLKGGVVQAFYSDATQEDYGSGSRKPNVRAIVHPDGGIQYLAEYRDNGPAGNLYVDQITDVRPDGSITIEITANWKGRKPAQLEWNPSRVWLGALVGATCQTEPDAASTRIARLSPGRSSSVNLLGPAWNHLDITAPGFATIHFNSLDKLTAFDAREDPYIGSQKAAWIGDPAIIMAPGVPIHRRLDIQIGAEPRPHGAVSGGENGKQSRGLFPHGLERSSLRLAPAGEHPALVPAPRELSWTEHNYIPKRSVALWLGPTAASSNRLQTACKEFAEDVRSTTNLRIQIRSAREAREPGGICLDVRPGVSAHPEGYRMSVQSSGVEISGDDEAGAFYGLQTLYQLVLTGEKPAFAGVDIVDWPVLKLRGAHIFVGKDALPCHLNLIRKVFARCKLNTLVIECEYTRWKSHPELWQPNSISPEDLHRVVLDAQTHFMQPVPLINTLGHTEWIFKSGVHNDLAEDPRSPHNYDPSNPATYDLVFDIFREALEIFDRPKLFHIGHDEVKVPSYDSIGRYPARPANILKGAGQLFLDDANHLAEWLRNNGARPMMWGDMLLYRKDGGQGDMTAAFAPSAEEAARRRAAIPPDAIVCDWRYEPGAEKRNGLKLFAAKGHETLACAWFQPANIRGWASQAAAAGAAGTLQTTWAGYDISELVLETDFKQFSAFVLAAEHAWNGGANSNAAVPAADIFRKQYFQFAAPSSGWYVDLSPGANIALNCQDDFTLPWGAYPHLEPAGLYADSASYNVPGEPDRRPTRLVGQHPAAIMLSGAANPAQLPTPNGTLTPIVYPDAIRFRIGRKASELELLHACGFPADEGDVVANYSVRYADGTVIEVPIRYGYEIRALDDQSECGLSTRPIRLKSLPGLAQQLMLRQLTWHNPHAERTIDSIEFRRNTGYAAPALFGIVGLERKKL